MMGQRKIGPCVRRIREDEHMKKILFGLVLTALCLSLCACGFTAGGTYPNADKYTVGNFTYDATTVKAVDISWIAGRVELVESDGGTLNVSEKQDGLTDDQLMRWWLDGTTIEIPKGIALTVHVTSGEIISGNHQLKEAHLSATSGEIELGAVNADSVTIELTSGSLKAGPMRAVKQIAMKCTSGEIEIDNAMADTVTLQSTSGKIEAGPIDAGKFTAECTSGDIKLEAVKTDNGHVKTTSGDIKLGVYQCGSVTVSCTSGDVVLSPVHGSGMTVDYNTNSGSLNGKGGQKTWHQVIGDGVSSVTVNTTSGDLKLNEK